MGGKQGKSDGDGETTMRALVTLGCLLFLSALVIGQEQKTTPPPKTEWVEINSYAKSIEQFTKRNPKGKRIFGNVASEEDTVDKWREFKSDKETEDQTLYENAAVWLKDGKVAVAYLEFTSPSGDWFHFVNYYFRADGTLAKIHEQLNTFYSPDGGISVVREKFYGSNGKLLHTSIRYLDLQSKKPRKRGEFADEPIPVYKTVRALPFAKLL